MTILRVVGVVGVELAIFYAGSGRRKNVGRFLHNTGAPLYWFRVTA